MDELAALSRIDPVAFRLRHLSDPRARKVVETAAARAGWSAFHAGETARGQGIAFARYKNLSAYVAVVAEVEVDREIAVRRVWAAVDAGVAINPDGLVSQIEGGVIQAVSWTLKEQVRADANGIATRTWSDYPILTFPEIPQVEVTLIDSDDEPVGAGEAAQGPTSAAIANAVYRAIGLRVRDMPFTPDRLATSALR
jgi:CO/xanthine dehydrogenase Mo-binding subunit